LSIFLGLKNLDNIESNDFENFVNAYFKLRSYTYPKKVIKNL